MLFGKECNLSDAAEMVNSTWNLIWYPRWSNWLVMVYCCSNYIIISAYKIVFKFRRISLPFHLIYKNGSGLSHYVCYAIEIIQSLKTFITIKSKKMKKKILSIAFGLAMILTTATCYAENKNPITRQEKATKAFNKEFNNSIVPTVYSSNGGFILKAVADGQL